MSFMIKPTLGGSVVRDKVSRTIEKQLGNSAVWCPEGQLGGRSTPTTRPKRVQSLQRQTEVETTAEPETGDLEGVVGTMEGRPELFLDLSARRSQRRAESAPNVAGGRVLVPTRELAAEVAESAAAQEELDAKLKQTMILHDKMKLELATVRVVEEMLKRRTWCAGSIQFWKKVSAAQCPQADDLLKS